MRMRIFFFLHKAVSRLLIDITLFEQTTYLFYFNPFQLSRNLYILYHLQSNLYCIILTKKYRIISKIWSKKSEKSLFEKINYSKLYQTLESRLNESFFSCYVLFTLCLSRYNIYPCSFLPNVLLKQRATRSYLYFREKCRDIFNKNSSIRLDPPATFPYCSTHVLRRHAGDLEISIRVSSFHLCERRCLAHYVSRWKENPVWIFYWKYFHESGMQK